MSDNYEPGRPIMTSAELARHKVDEHGRDYSRSDDGYSDMEVAAEEGWHAISGWAQDGYDLGDWPYVVISARNAVTVILGVRVGTAYEMRQTCEGDTTVYRFESVADRNAAIDFLFIWYGIGRDYDKWPALGIPAWCDETSSYPARAALDAGTLRVPTELRGPFSWARCDAARAAS